MVLVLTELNKQHVSITRPLNKCHRHSCSFTMMRHQYTKCLKMIFMCKNWTPTPFRWSHLISSVTGCWQQMCSIKKKDCTQSDPPWMDGWCFLRVPVAFFWSGFAHSQRRLPFVGGVLYGEGNGGSSSGVLWICEMERLSMLHKTCIWVHEGVMMVVWYMSPLPKSKGLSDVAVCFDVISAYGPRSV